MGEGKVRRGTLLLLCVAVLPGSATTSSALVAENASSKERQAKVELSTTSLLGVWNGQEDPAVPAVGGTVPALGESVLASAEEQSDSCDVEMRRSAGALNVATYFSWYRSRAQFRCMSSQPIEGFFRSKNRRRIRAHLRRLDEHGFHAIAGVIYADPAGEGKAEEEMRWLLKAVREARRLGFQFVPLYDFSIASHLSANLCNVFAGRCAKDDVRVEEYNFDRHPILQETVLENLVMIAERFIVPFTDFADPSNSTVRFLHDTDGNLVLDDLGLPRPEIYIYIPRVWTDDSDFATITEVLDEVTEAYRQKGLGMPAYTLDVLMPLRRPFDPERVAAFGESAVRITPFFGATDRAADLGELAREHRKMYRRTQRQLARAINRGQIHSRLQIAGGTVVNFDKRGWSSCQGGFNSVAWPALGADHWIDALAVLVEHTTEPVCSESEDSSEVKTPFRNSRFLYAGEGFEATWLCAEEGPSGARYPNRYGCEPLEGFGELMDLLGER